MRGRCALIILPMTTAKPDSVLGPAFPEPDRKVPCKSGPGWTLAIHVFSPPGWTAADTRPAIVFFFGGGWRKGSPAQFYPHCRYLASRGMVAMSAEYRVESVHGATPFDCVADGQSAVRWIRGHAAELGIDPARLAAGGGSAGGHVAAATAVCRPLDGEGADGSCRPSALVLFNPVVDNAPTGYGVSRIGPRWREISPLHNLCAGAPPTILFLGTADALVPVATAREYARRIEESGGRCEVCLYDGQPHAFFNYRDGANPFYYATVREADRFLASLGYLSGPPTLRDNQKG